MTDQPLVSVVIPTYNSAHFAVTAVESVLAQTYPNVEVIVVDDGSVDDTGARLKAYGERVRYTWQKNGGVSKARNAGIMLARGELIAFLDADDRWMPTKLEKQIGCLRRQPDVALIHTDILRWYEATGAQTHEPANRGRFSGTCIREFFWNNRVITSTVLVRRECLDDVGVFDEAVRGPSAEDMDLWIRIARAYKLAYVDEPLALYRVHVANGSANLKRMTEDELYVFRKALRESPELQEQLGTSNVRGKLTELAFNAGYLNLEAGQFGRGRSYFRQALAYSPLDPKLWLLYASTVLPPNAWNTLRVFKRRTAHAIGRTPQ